MRRHASATRRSPRRTTRACLIRRAFARCRESPKRRFILHVFPPAIFHCMKGAPGPTVSLSFSVYSPRSFSFLVFLVAHAFTEISREHTYSDKVRGLFASVRGIRMCMCVLCVVCLVCVYVCVYTCEYTCANVRGGASPFGIEKEGKSARRECEGDERDRATDKTPNAARPRLIPQAYTHPLVFSLSTPTTHPPGRHPPSSSSLPPSYSLLAPHPSPLCDPVGPFSFRCPPLWLYAPSERKPTHPRSSRYIYIYIYILLGLCVSLCLSLSLPPSHPFLPLACLLARLCRLSFLSLLFHWQSLATPSSNHLTTNLLPPLFPFAASTASVLVIHPLSSFVTEAFDPIVFVLSIVSVYLVLYRWNPIAFGQSKKRASAF